MKKFLTFAVIAFSSMCVFAEGVVDFFNNAKTQAKNENKAIFLIYSGIEWCGPCKRYEAKILKSSAFKTYAKKNLIVIDVDIKRDKDRTKVVSVDGKEIKVESKDKQAFSEALEKVIVKYPFRGVPHSVLIDKDGNELYTIRGYSGEKPKVFVDNLMEKLKK